MRQECALLLASVANSVQAAPSPEDLQRFVSTMGAERDVETLLVAAGQHPPESSPAPSAPGSAVWCRSFRTMATPGRTWTAPWAGTRRTRPTGAVRVFDMTRPVWIPGEEDSGKLVPGIIMVHVRSAETEAAMFRQAVDLSWWVGFIVALGVVVRVLIERRVLKPLAAVLTFVRDPRNGCRAGRARRVASGRDRRSGRHARTAAGKGGRADRRDRPRARAAVRRDRGARRGRGDVRPRRCARAVQPQVHQQWASLHGQIVPGITAHQLAGAYAKGRYAEDAARAPPRTRPPTSSGPFPRSTRECTGAGCGIRAQPHARRGRRDPAAGHHGHAADPG